MIISSVDLGKTSDFTAYGQLGLFRLPDGRNRYDLVHAERRHGTDDPEWRGIDPKTGRRREFYEAVVARVNGLHRAPPLFTNSVLAVDATGVGAGVVEMFRREMHDLFESGLLFFPFTITPGLGGPHPGRETRSIHVSKAHLCDHATAILDEHRFKWSASLALGSEIKKELQVFEKTYTKHQNVTFQAREGKKDDLVLMSCMGFCVGECLAPWYRTGGQIPLGTRRR